jgi:hypothetical protein
METLSHNEIWCKFWCRFRFFSFCANFVSKLQYAKTRFDQKETDIALKIGTVCGIPTSDLLL